MRQHASRMPWATDLVIFQPVGQGYGQREIYVARPLLAEARPIAEREFPDGRVSWEVRPFSDGRASKGEDRYARLLNIKGGARHGLPDSMPDHPVPTPPIGASTSPRGPPD